MVAVVVLTAWAIRTAVTALRRHRSPTVARSTTGLATPWRAYGGLLGLTLLNPATIVYFGALVLGSQGGDLRSTFDRSVFVLSAFVASASWQLLIAGSGSLLGRLLTGPRGKLVTALAVGQERASGAPAEQARHPAALCAARSAPGLCRQLPVRALVPLRFPRSRQSPTPIFLPTVRAFASPK